MFLKFLAEQGILGLLVYPGALIAAAWGAPHPTRRLVLTFGSVWLVYGLFTHNEFEYRHVLVVLALVAAITVASRSTADAPLAGHAPLWGEWNRCNASYS